MSTKTVRREPRLVVRRSKLHGRGVFARAPIRKGETIVEYKGERITEDEIERRYPEKRNGINHTFVFGIEYDLNIDGGSKGNIARWINHSCDGNCETYEEDQRIFIRAARGIRPGEELTYDYAIELDEPLTPALKACWPCWCGTRNCRGTVLVKPPRRRPKKASSTRSSQGSSQRTKTGSSRRTKAGSPPRKQTGSSQRTKTGSPPRTRAGSPPRKQTGSPPRKQTGSSQRTKTGSPPRARAG